MTWLIPTIITLACLGGAYALQRTTFPKYPTEAEGWALTATWLFAALIALIAWLVWALLK